MRILSIDHVQLAMPAGGEAEARAFYHGVLGLPEVAKPESLRASGGVWFRAGPVRVHLGVTPEFQPALKAHPCFEVDALEEAIERCRAASTPPTAAEPIEGIRRCYVSDPFGNRIELMEHIGPESRE